MCAMIHGYLQNLLTRFNLLATNIFMIDLKVLEEIKL